MNDDSNLYVRISAVSASVQAIAIHFDNDNDGGGSDGYPDTGDDWIHLDRTYGFTDNVWVYNPTFCGEFNPCTSDDKIYCGTETTNGAGYFDPSITDGFALEMSHPLPAPEYPDSECDFDLIAGDTVGFTLVFIDGYWSWSYPASSPYNQGTYGDIVLALSPVATYDLAGDWVWRYLPGKDYSVRIDYDPVTDLHTLGPPGGLIFWGEYEIGRNYPSDVLGKVEDNIENPDPPPISINQNGNPNYPCWTWRIIDNNNLEYLQYSQDCADEYGATYNYSGATLSRVSGADVDGDGVPDAIDNCPDEPNSGQEDGDDDGAGDACDNCPGLINYEQDDSDNDGIGNACDNCRFTWNVDQLDSDNLGCLDVTPCPDGKGDRCDNCPNVYNPGQEDFDGDAIPGIGGGDACESPEDIDEIIFSAEAKNK